MKKRLILAVAILFYPLSASGMQILTKPEMAAVFARAGVAIEFNDVVFRDYREDLEIWYQPSDTAVGFVATGEPYQVLHINSIRSGDPDSDRPHGFYSEETDLKGSYTYRFDYANAVDPVTGEAYFEPRPLTVSYEQDLPVMGQILDSQWAAERPGEARRPPVAGIAFGLPTLEVYTEPGSYDAFDILITTALNPLDRIGRAGTPEAPRDTWSYGTLYYSEGGGAMSILSGRIEIMPLETYRKAQPST